VLNDPAMRGGFGRWAAGIALCASMSLGTAARATIYGGGGSSRTDCLLVFDAPVNDPESRPKRVRCTDGDSNCDGDGVVNGQCLIAVGVCGNSTFDPLRCTSNGLTSAEVDHAQDNGDAKFDPDFQALQTRINTGVLENPDDPDRCTTPTNIRVPITGPTSSGSCKLGKKQVKITTLFIQGPKPVKDTDKLLLICDPPDPCDPGVLFTGTFDRIQRQIFNRSCALSGCHDSQTQAGGMLLESGGAYSNIVDVVPDTPPAAALGWLRIDAANADPETSFMYHKLTGDLPDPELGERMPFGRPKLESYLIDILRLWIEAGAPPSPVWVPGTD